jgi:hypothetical protein
MAHVLQFCHKRQQECANRLLSWWSRQSAIASHTRPYVPPWCPGCLRLNLFTNRSIDASKRAARDPCPIPHASTNGSAGSATQQIAIEGPLTHHQPGTALVPLGQEQVVLVPPDLTRVHRVGLELHLKRQVPLQVRGVDCMWRPSGTISTYCIQCSSALARSRSLQRSGCQLCEH